MAITLVLSPSLWASATEGANPTGGVGLRQAGGGIFLPGTQPEELTLQFLQPSKCAECHGLDEKSPNVLWPGSMMANSFRDPVFRAALAVANQDISNVGEFCLRCHTPTGWLAGQSLPGDGSRVDRRVGVEGVSCDFCHRIEERSLIGNGQFFITDEPISYGPFGVGRDGARMQAKVGRLPVFSAHVTRSELCAICHDVTNPLNQLPIESTYTEWKNSAFAAEGKQCQDCHMPTPRRPPRVPQHFFVGGNAWVPLALAEMHPELDRQAAYERTASLAAELLGEAASIEVEFQPADTVDALAAAVTVTNLSGHKLPTGYPEGRRMWLHVVARDEAGKVIFESGRYDPEEAALIKDPQLKVYEVKLGIAGEGETFHFILNQERVKDNRIPPRGYVPVERTNPFGAEYAPGQNWDLTSYRVPLADAQGAVTVTAELLYQTSSREYIQFLRDENSTDDWGQRLFDIWQQTGQSTPVLMAATEASWQP